jgi:Flavodoxin reductases (ferredoxin-NADPH reductases) family 1
LERLNWQIGHVIAMRNENERTKSLLLSVPHWPSHQAGQHIDLRLTAEDGYQVERSYSIASPPEEQRQIWLTVVRVDDGEVSPYLVDELRVGDGVELRGPIGGYFVWNATMRGPLLLIGGGSGIVPLMAILRHRAAIGSTVPVRLLVSWRSPADVIYRDELVQLVQNNPNLTIYQTFTRTPPVDWTGYHRRIDVALLQEVVWPVVRSALTFVCGPTPFVETAAAGLVTLGYAAPRIKTERFGATGES